MVTRPKTASFYDKYDNAFKEIVYPTELHYTEIEPNDPIDDYIHNIMELMPDWQKIEICDL